MLNKKIFFRLVLVSMVFSVPVSYGLFEIYKSSADIALSTFHIINFLIYFIALFIGIIIVLPKTAVEDAGESGDSQREAGTVKWFNGSKGFGFITMDDGEEVFVHFRSIRGEGRRFLNDGQRVEFDLAQGAKGPQAEDVVVIGK
jgi:CspA family cold shock protein